MPYALHLNYVLNCGIFPDTQSDGLLVPMHKKRYVNVSDDFHTTKCFRETVHTGTK